MQGRKSRKRKGDSLRGSRSLRVVAAWVSYSGVTQPDISSPCISVCSSPVFRDCSLTTVVFSVGISRVVLKPETGRASLLLGMSQQDELSIRGTAGWRTCDQMLGSLRLVVNVVDGTEDGGGG